MVCGGKVLILLMENFVNHFVCEDRLKTVKAAFLRVGAKAGADRVRGFSESMSDSEGLGLHPVFPSSTAEAPF